VKTVILLIISNAFMNIAWYGHLKYRNEPLLLVILASWGIALFEYIFQVPANRIGAEKFTVTRLKIIQECITLFVFTVIAYLLFHEPLQWNSVISYVLIIAAVYFAFLGQHKEPEVGKQSEEMAQSSGSEEDVRVIARS
jgi:uncharacterized protein (DUF486 family)